MNRCLRSPLLLSASTVFAMFVLALGGCPPQPGTGDPNDPNQGSGDPNEPTGTTFTLGDAVRVLGITVPTGGGTIKIDDTSSPLHDIELTVPDSAYPDDREFVISFQPINDHNLGDDVQVLTPLIVVENGGDVADAIMEMKVPVDVPDGHFAMAFFYNEETGELEGIPDIDRDDESITIITQHFSKICFASMAIELLFGTLDTGFEVGVDNWPFANPISYLDPGGTCSGMAVTAMYYFEELKATEGPLWDRYNNNGPPAAATSLGEDDEHALQLCSTVQWFSENFRGHEFWYWLGTGENKGQLWTFYKFALALQLTKKPQYIGIFPDEGAGHAMLVYKKVGRNKLYMADSNFPNDADAHIVFDLEAEKMETYTSKNNAVTGDVQFTKMFYLGKTALLDWAEIGGLFAKMGTDAVGAEFPSYTIKVVEKGDGGNDATSTLGATYAAQTKVLQFRVDCDYDYLIMPCNGSETQPLLPIGDPGPMTYFPSDGEKKLGLCIYAEREVPDPEDPNSTVDVWAWAGFQWTTITYTDPAACVYEGSGRWLMKWYYDCDGELDSDATWILHEDGTISHYFLGPISDYSWKVEIRSGKRYLVITPSEEFDWVGELSENCRSVTTGFTELKPGSDANPICWSAERY